MDYRYLQAFLLTAEHLSFSKAANELQIAQSAVSRQVKLLESSLGEEVIIRSSKKVLLTNKGKQLYFALKHFEKMANNIFEQEDKAPLKIGILHGLLENWFGPYLKKYYNNFNKNIEIIVKSQNELRNLIEEGKLDLIFSTENIQSEIISSLKLFDETLILISKDDIDINDLTSHRWIVYGPADHLYSVSEKNHSSFIEVESITTIVNLVKQGIGIAVVPDHAIKNEDQLICNKLPKMPKSEIFMTSLNYKTLPKNISEFINIL
ncbi:MAG: LysR family transcriptional regulator [Bdellovibrionales bacterium]|jgi:DNA-binding transcriptional LysR family regulator|nr:LysR family transcriptional regulator [Bdellovibrionales bacterium]